MEMVLEEIRRRVAALRCRNALPRHVLLLELRRWAHGRGMPDGELLSSLAALRDSGRIEVGRTLNDWWIRPVEEGGAK